MSDVGAELRRETLISNADPVDFLSLLKPRVRAFYSIRSREKILPQSLDLASPDCRDHIVSPESPEKWGLGNLEALWQ